MERVVQRIVVTNEKKDWVYSLGGGDRVGLMVPGITAQRLGGKEMGGLIFFRNGGHTDIELLEEPSKWSMAFKDADRIHVRIGEEQFYFDFKGDEIVFATKGFEHLYEAFIVFNDENKLNLIGKQLDDKQLEGEEASTEGILVFDKSPTHIGVEEAKKIHEVYLENNLGTSKHRMPGKDFEEIWQWNEDLRQRDKEDDDETLTVVELDVDKERCLESIGFKNMIKKPKFDLQDYIKQVCEDEEVEGKEEFISTKKLKRTHASATITAKDVAIDVAKIFIDKYLKHMPYYELHEDQESVSVSFSFNKKRFE